MSHLFVGFIKYEHGSGKKSLTNIFPDCILRALELKTAGSIKLLFKGTRIGQIVHNNN